MTGDQVHVLLTNDDGPPNKWHSPYIQPLVNQILSDTDWLLTIVVPERQRSWTSKAHMIGEGVKASYLYTKGLEEESAGPFEAPKIDLRNGTENWTEWTLLAATPASCANIGHKFIGPRRQNKPVDLVISGPNYGINTSAAYITSSGTVGAAVEAAVNGSRSIALSFCYTRPEHTAEEIKNACKLSLDIISHLMENWDDGVEVYSINLPLFADLDPENPPPIRFVPVLENKWSSIFDLEVTNGGAEIFHWSPDFDSVNEGAFAAGPGSDAWAVMHNEVSVSPIKGVFQNVNVTAGDLILKKKKLAFIDERDSYVARAWKESLRKCGIYTLPIVDNPPVEGVFIYEDYDSIDFEKRCDRNLVYSYAYRKALTRKNYLAVTVAHYVAKNPNSVLKNAVPVTYDLEVDYAEFLDDALDESWDLRQELEGDPEKMWILKPSLGDRAHGIRVFAGIEELQQIFNDFENEIDEENCAMRQYIVQNLISDVFLIDERKFHLRVYVLCSGALTVWVSSDILVLFSGADYMPESRELASHITNTCFQGAGARVETLKDLDRYGIDTTAVYERVCLVVSDLFKAAAADTINFQPLPNAIEFFGLDFLVDSNQGVHLLEVNAYPDFKQTGEELKYVVQGLFDGAVAEVIAPFYSESFAQNKALTKVYSENIRK